MRSRRFLTRSWVALLAEVLGAAMQLTAPVRADDRVFGDPSLWRWAPSRAYHVKNYRLKLRFDAAKGQVFGDELLTLTPFVAGFRRFHLDSVDLTIESVSLFAERRAPVSLAFEERGEQLWITLDRDYLRGEHLKVRIVYHGTPRFGLFFEHPDDQHPDRPLEIWTQGESEFNHHWFPCWDYPNDMATSETITTVPEGQVVVSNGRLVSVSHSRGAVTYDWRESVPHSTYLTSLAIGSWQKVHDSYHGKPVDYYVPRGTDEATTRRAFGLTPDMIALFSRLTIEYPYEKYAQVAVRDFAFGGMENVSATTLRESVLQDAQGAADFPAIEVVAHELAQHWFGDFVQGRDWANIWLNEGFATYLPALYTQYHEGNDAYRLQMQQYQETARAQDQHDYLRAIVDHHYTDDGMQMFDSITHEKGAAVLDMMRYVLDGPAAARQVGPAHGPFFSALRYYLIRHAADTADTADLIAAVRTVTGENLDSFFHQWVYSAGSPAYQVRAVYDPVARSETISLNQIQQGRNVPALFEMPVEFAFHGQGGEQKRIQLLNDQVRQTFTVPLGFEPLWVDFDPDGFIEKTVDFPQSVAALSAAALQDPCMSARLWAVGELGRVQRDDVPEAARALSRVLATDGFYGVRVAAAAGLGQLRTTEARQALLAGLHQDDSRVRSASATALGEFHADAQAYAALVDALRTDPSYAAKAAAALSVGRSGVAGAFERLVAERVGTSETHVASALQAALAATGDERAMELLLADAGPGEPARLRVSALSALVSMKGVVTRHHTQELATVLTQALGDPYLPLQQMAQDTVAAFHLVQLEPQIAAATSGAPTLWQRKLALGVLEQLRAAPSDRE